MPSALGHVPTVCFGSPVAVEYLPGLRSSIQPGNSILPMTLKNNMSFCTCGPFLGPKDHPQTALQLQDGCLELRGSALRDGRLETALPGYPGDIAQDHHQRGCLAQLGSDGMGMG